MGELIPFPKRDREVMRVQTIATEGVIFRGQCEGIIHCFSTVPGSCECGQEFWGEVIPPGIGVYQPPNS